MTALPHELNSPDTLLQRFAAIRAQTLALAAPLSSEDCQVQSMPDASPTKWHLAHTTWFFETFVLERFERGFAPFHPAFRVLFNSYYEGVGDKHPRPQRGLVTRPSLDQVMAYRTAVDDRMTVLLAQDTPAEAAALVELGSQHEQQHQELLLTDVKHLLSCNPLAPAYQPARRVLAAAALSPQWMPFDGGVVEIGYGGAGFAFDNEMPRHRRYLQPFALSSHPVTQAQWSDFIADGGYAEPRWWLSAGWDWVRTQRTEAPLYWQRAGAAWYAFTLHGLAPIDPLAPVVHVSYYEADAYARWRAAQDALPLRLPTEVEWEHAAERALGGTPRHGNFMESGVLHPTPPARAADGLVQMFGDTWEWTSSAYEPYPGFRAWEGPVGEYNAKFMVNQYVLRGGSCATPRSHIRASYRNFFPADARWQFSGVRLAYST